VSKSKSKGKVKEALGWLTADRKAEAEGRVEQEVADPVKEADEVNDETVAEKTDTVREEYGELLPEADERRS